MARTLTQIEKIGIQIEQIIKPLPGTRSVYAERVSGGYFVDFTLKREQLARYGLTIQDAEDIIMSAVGGENVTTAIRRARNVIASTSATPEIFAMTSKNSSGFLCRQCPAHRYRLRELADISVSSWPFDDTR